MGCCSIKYFARRIRLMKLVKIPAMSVIKNGPFAALQNALKPSFLKMVIRFMLSPDMVRISSG